MTPRSGVAGVVPCRRPRVNVQADGDALTAVCRVPGCLWRYRNVIRTDVEEQARHHRNRHRTALPVAAVIHPEGEPWLVECACGFTRQDGTTTTRVDADGVLERHLVAVHGLVTCS